MTTFSLETRLAGLVADVRPRVEAGLQREGFGLVTEIDLRATLKARLGEDGPAYLILGACNPHLAQRAITADPSVGTLLPCNVVLRQDGDDTIVEALDPVAVLGLIDRSDVASIAHEARDRLARVLADLVSRP